jgi:hypothetical protein
MGLVSSLPSMIPVWLLAVIGAVLVGVLAGEAYLTWLPVVAALCILVSFAIQLALRRTEGLVKRLGGSMVGAFTVLVVATLVLVLAKPVGVHFLA